MLLIIECMVLFGPAILLTAVGLAVFPLALIMGSQGMLWGVLPVVMMEIFSLLGLYSCFQLVRKYLDATIIIPGPLFILTGIVLGFVAMFLFGLMGAFYLSGWNIYVLAGPSFGAFHLLYLNRAFLFRKYD